MSYSLTALKSRIDFRQFLAKALFPTAFSQFERKNPPLSDLLFGLVSFTSWFHYLQKTVPNFAIKSPEQTLDLNYVFVDVLMRHSNLSAFLWLCIADHLSQTSAPKIVYFVDAQNKNLMKLYEKISEGTLGTFNLKGIEGSFSLLWSTPA
jgi:hypothetical protein